MPLHTGHLNLIDYGLKYCKKITLLLVASKDDPIEAELRYSWLLEHYKEYKNISVDVTYRDNINALPQRDRTSAWCKFVKEEYPNLDSIISSETYGDTLADYLGVKHLKFDHKREITPISATEIRDNYKKHIHYLPDHVKVFFNNSEK
ncbi:hypothetical protein EW093_10585 [Thiospirochaeta perfilievii]|uniref:Cytidyltransferase-like domain-containing protein n=1 Tax=Thiospirochaeta perfilievii TaxID=252967 RepID=A0A5C1QDT1_9SPIO|nr:hypothetical protein [Thiospirochaeta perfilievii]QEN05139.1 hypothetical protein EW093_10585 [Thiospirochaeta perfilievii]